MFSWAEADPEVAKNPKTNNAAAQAADDFGARVFCAERFRFRIPQMQQRVCDAPVARLRVFHRGTLLRPVAAGDFIEPRVCR
jgi:hypothetical protein